MEQKTAQFSRTGMAYTVYEQPGAQALLLVHGFGETGSVWNNQIATLNTRYRVIVPDLPGSGRSPHNDALMDIDAMAVLLHELMCYEQAEQHLMFGHSMGGYITMAYAEKYAESLSAFGSVHSSAYADSEEKKAARRKSIGFIQEHGALKFLEQTLPNLFAGKYVEQHKKALGELLAQAALFAPETLIGYYEAMIRRPDRTEILRKTKAPVLFITGVYDEAVPFSHTLEQSHLPDMSYIHVLEKSGHMGMLEEPGQLNQALNEFLTQIS